LTKVPNQCIVLVTMKEKVDIFVNFLGGYYKSREELLFKCPFCDHHKKKLSLNIKMNVFKCWVCDSKGGLKYLVSRFASKDDKYQWSLLTQSIDMAEPETFFEDKQAEAEQTVELPEEFICLANKSLPYSAKEARLYLSNRGMSKEDIVYYKIGYCREGKYKNRIIFPSFNTAGDCNYFIARSYSGDWLKYKKPPVPSNKIIFNDLLIDWTKPIVLVEGVFDAIKSRNSIPVLGSTLDVNSKLFQKLVTHQPKIYLGFDQDALKKTYKVVSNLLQHGLEVYNINTSEIEDIGSISKRKVKELIETSVPMTFENLMNLQWRTHG
jgi:DNA primase